MSEILLVASGGALGSLARYQLTGWTLALLPNIAFPVGTFLVNLTGCLLAGAVVGIGERHQLLTADSRLLLITGLCGGFTTFSSFSLELVGLLRNGQLLTACVYAGLTVVLGVLALAMALRLAASITA